MLWQKKICEAFFSGISSCLDWHLTLTHIALCRRETPLKRMTGALRMRTGSPKERIQPAASSQRSLICLSRAWASLQLSIEEFQLHKQDKHPVDSLQHWLIMVAILHSSVGDNRSIITQTPITSQQMQSMPQPCADSHSHLSLYDLIQ